MGPKLVAVTLGEQGVLMATKSRKEIIKAFKDYTRIRLNMGRRTQGIKLIVIYIKYKQEQISKVVLLIFLLKIGAFL